MFEILKSAEFSAAHSLRNYDGPCARNHGHNYKIEIVVTGHRLDERRMIIDFVDMDKLLAPILKRVDHQNLNEIPPFDEINPTAEAIAAWFFTELKQPINTHTDGRGHLSRIRLWETPDSCVTYSEED